MISKNFSNRRKKQKSDNFEGEKLGYKFLSQVQALQGCDTNPIYALLHESIYCQQEVFFFLFFFFFFFFLVFNIIITL